MRLIKIAIFGISDWILEHIRNDIDPRRAEIVSFIDNSKDKQGTFFMDIPVDSLEKVNIHKIDYFLVSAISAYEQIKEQLIGVGVCKEKIQPYVPERLCEYYLGNIDDIDEDFIYAVYFEPSKKIKIVEKYKKLYKEYIDIPVFEENANDWFQKSNLISHACGGMVNGKRIMYSNSKEAFQYSVESGFRIIECDILGLEKGELFLAHDYWRVYEAKEKQYTMLTVRDFFTLLKQHTDITCLIDVKWNSKDEYAVYIDEIEKLINAVCETEDEKKCLKDQIVMEVYDEETIKNARAKKFNMIFTQYRNPDRECFMNTVNICYKYGINAVAFPMLPYYYEQKYVKIVTNKNIKIFVFSTDSVEDYVMLKQRGIKGIFTNYLTEKDFDLKEA